MMVTVPVQATAVVQFRFHAIAMAHRPLHGNKNVSDELCGALVVGITSCSLASCLLAFGKRNKLE